MSKRPRNCDGETFETWDYIPDDETCTGCELPRVECAELCEEADNMDRQEDMFT